MTAQNGAQLPEHRQAASDQHQMVPGTLQCSIHGHQKVPGTFGGMRGRIRDTLELIKFSHTVFALPFAIGAMIVAANGWPGWRPFLLILAAMVTGRSFAMAWNRLVDHAIDAQNPRTATRHLPQGIVTRRYVAFFCLVMGGLFLITCRLLNPLAFALSPVALTIWIAYSYTKRFMTWTHLVLGISLGMAPVGAGIAVSGMFDAALLLLGAAVCCWVAGFDIIYATQDAEFDRTHRLHSVVARHGIAKGLRFARALHLLGAAGLLGFGWLAALTWPYFIAVLAMIGGLVYQHTLVRAHDLSRVNMAFFTVNGWISGGFLAGILLHYVA